MAKNDIGQVLVETGILTHEQVANARIKAEQGGVRLEVILIESAALTQEQLAQGYATLFSLPFLDSISDIQADPAQLAKIPLAFLRSNSVIPIIYNTVPTVITAKPYDFAVLDDIKLVLGGRVNVAVAPEPVIMDSVNRYYPLEGAQAVMDDLEQEVDDQGSIDFNQIDEGDILAMETDAPIIKFVNHVLFQAVKREASDIHIEPFEKEVRVRFRIDGVMHEILRPPKRIQAALSSRIKIMANLNIAEKRIPQDGRIQIKVADKAIDIRVSILPVNFGERIVMRLLDKSKSFVPLGDLGMSERDYKVLSRSISRPNGIILVSGPTGSGKTTTLYSILNQLNSPKDNIITVENPVEYQMGGIAQVQVKEKVGLTFAAALRSILRQDPDIIMLGETRDIETAQIAIQAALTGHLVLSTIHTNGAPATITRLIDMGIEPFLIASTIDSVTAQRLVRKLCDKSKKVYKPTPEQIDRLGITQQEADGITFYKPVACDECSSGYKGRIAIFEVMTMTPELAKLTNERSSDNQLEDQAIKDGMRRLIDDGIEKIKAGITTIEEVLSVAYAND